MPVVRYFTIVKVSGLPFEAPAELVAVIMSV